MKKQIVLLSTLVFCSLSSSAQSIKGKLKLAEHWKQVVYLIEVSDYGWIFSGSSKVVIDSFYASSEGYFQFENLKRNTLYRLNVIPDSSDVEGGLIQDGTHDNYAFFITNDSDKKLYFTGDVSGLYLSATVISDDKNLNDLQKQLKAIEETKTPVYTFMAAPENDSKRIPETDTAGQLAFQQRVMPQLMKLFEETNISLLQYLQTRTNPQVISFGLAYYGFEQNIQDKGLMPVIDKLKPYEKDPLAHTILMRTKDLVEPTDKSFLSKAYPLLDGGNIVLDTISSRFILMDFWASWCLPCRKGIKGEIKQLQSSFSKQELQIIGINKDEIKENARQAIKKDGNNAIQIWDGAEGELSKYFKINGIPFYVLIDTQTKKVEVVNETTTLGKRLREMLDAGK
jgi:thiol-disulfide isomerase/thioredoxin